MDKEDLVDLLLERYPTFSPDTIRAVLDQNDCRLSAAEQALEAMSSRQGTGGASTSAAGVRVLIGWCMMQHAGHLVMQPRSPYDLNDASVCL